MHGIERHILFPLPKILGIDLSITNEVVLLWLAAIVTFVLLAMAFRRRNLVARGWFQNIFELLFEVVEKEAVRGSIGKESAACMARDDIQVSC